jgi:hypothetical protein
LPTSSRLLDEYPMGTAYATAALVSLAFGLSSIPLNRYRYWHRYIGRTGHIAILVAGQVVIYGAAGPLVGLLANLTHAQTLYTDGFVSGFIYGAVPHGAALVPLPGLPSQNLGSTRSVLGRVLHWLRQSLDDLAYTGLRDQVNRLEDDETLIARVWDVFFDGYYADKKIKPRTKNTQARNLKEAIAQVRDDQGERAEGLGRLRNFVIGEVSRTHDPNH